MMLSAEDDRGAQYGAVVQIDGGVVRDAVHHGNAVFVYTDVGTVLRRVIARLELNEVFRIAVRAGERIAEQLQGAEDIAVRFDDELFPRRHRKGKLGAAALKGPGQRFRP